MNLAVRVVFLTALFLETNLFVFGEQRDSLSALIIDAKDEPTKAMLYLELADSKENDRLQALREAENIFKSNQNNTVGIETYLKFGKYYLSSLQRDSALIYFEKALYLSEIFNDQFYRGRSNQEIGNYYYTISDFTQAGEFGLKAKDIFAALKDTFWLLPQINFLAQLKIAGSEIEKGELLYQDVIKKGISHRDWEAIAVANLGLGNISLLKADYLGAFNYLKNSKNIWEANNSLEKLPLSLNKLGQVYLAAGLDSLALKTLNKSLEINNNADLSVTAEAYIGLASVYLNNNDSEGALNAVNETIQKANAVGNVQLYISGIIKKAEILCLMKSYAESQVLVEGALTIIEEKNLPVYKPEALEILSQAYYFQGEEEEAAKIAAKALDEAKAINNIEQIQKNSFMLGQIMNEKGQFISASRMLLMSNQYKDSLNIQQENNQLKNAVFQYELAGTAATSAVVQVKGPGKTKLQNKEGTDSRLQNLLFVSIILLVLLIAFFTILIFKGYRTNRKLYNDLLPGKNAENKNTELEKLAILNNKIFSVISHDLRSPIISIKDSIDFLRQEGLDEETKQEALILSEELTEATLNLLDNLLGWAKNQKKRVDPKKLPVKINSEISQIGYLYKASFNKKEITFRIDCSEDVVALADNELVNLALRNLVSNAVKFTPRGGSIFIAGESVNNKIIVSVKDTGIGISKEDQMKILALDTFFTKNGTENESGSGIGLKLVNEFVKLMGGELRIESSPGQGSTFIFTLPAYDVKKNPNPHDSFFKQTVN